MSGRPHTSNSKPLLYMISFLGVSFYYLINVVLDWPIFKGKYLGTEQPYLDLYQTVVQIKCVENRAAQIGFSSASHDCGYIYSRFLYELISISKVKVDHVFVIGSLLIVTLIIFLFQVLWRTDLPQFRIQYLSFSLLLICSPPMMLLMERGNIDVVVVSLLLMATSSFGTSRNYPKLITFTVATMMKFYTYSTLLILSLFANERQRLKYVLFAFSVIPFVVIDINSVKSNLPYPTEAAFGVSLARKYLIEGETNRVADFFFGVSLLCVAMMVVTKIDARYTILPTCIRYKEINFRSNSFGFLVFCSVFLVNYFITSSYDYRLVFLIVTGWFFSSIVVFTPRQGFLWILLMLISFWFSFNTGRLQVIGDISLGVIVAILMLSIYRIGPVTHQVLFSSKTQF